MEKVALLIDGTGQRIRCLLNPETLVLRRTAGIEARSTAGGQLTGAGLSDQPLLFTGGGVTEIELDLLFDVSLAGSSIQSDNVRDLTRPLWDLAENRGEGDEQRPPQVRFLWGKVWDIPAVVMAVAERLEHFSPSGAPRRAWLRLLLRRVNDAGLESPAPVLSLPGEQARLPGATGSDSGLRMHPIVGGLGLPSGPMPSLALSGLAVTTPTLFEASLTAGGVILSALAQTRTAGAIANLLLGVGGLAVAAVAAVIKGADALITAIGQSEVVQGLRQAAIDAGAAVQAALSAVAEEMHAGFVAAAGAARRAAGAAKATLSRIASQVEEAVREKLAAVAEELRPVTDAIREAVSSMTDALAETLKDIGESAPVQAVMNAGRRLVDAVVEFINSPSFLTDAFQAVARVAGDAFDTMKDAAQALSADVRDVIDASMEALEPLVNQIKEGAREAIDFAQAVALPPLQAAFADMRNVGGAFVQAAGIMAPVVKEYATRLAGQAARYVETAAGNIRAVLGPLLAEGAAAVSAAARGAAQGARDTLSDIDDLLRAMAQDGVMVGEAFLRALGILGGNMDALWLAGAGPSVRMIQPTVGAAVTAARQIGACEEAVAAVSAGESREALDEQLAAAEEALAAVEEAPEAIEPQQELAGAAEAAAGVVGALRPGLPAESGQPLSDAASDLQEAVDAVIAGEEAAPAAAKETVERLKTNLEEAVKSEKAQVATRVREMVARAEPPAPQALSAEAVVEAGAPGGETHQQKQGERLDQIAYDYYRNPAGWRLLAIANDIDHPLRLDAGRMLRVPPPT